jgi:photosystem II stability/assembly factor-like uncharacterized protein
VTLWRTDDGGWTWRQLTAAGVPDAGIKSQLLFFAASRGVLNVQAADGTQSVWATDDGGDTWRQTMTLHSPRATTWARTARLIAHDGRLLAGLLTVSADQVSRQGGIFPTGSDPHYDVDAYVFASGDGGVTWGPPLAGPHLLTRFIGTPLMDARGRLLLLEGRRLWVSPDDGATWTARVIQAPADVDPAFLVSTARGALLAAGSRAGATTDRRFVGALLRSTDGGVHWQEVALPAGL